MDLDFLELKLHTVSHHVGAGNLNLASLEEQTVVLTSKISPASFLVSYQDSTILGIGYIQEKFLHKYIGNCS